MNCYGCEENDAAHWPSNNKRHWHIGTLGQIPFAQGELKEKWLCEKCREELLLLLDKKAAEERLCLQEYLHEKQREVSENFGAELREQINRRKNQLPEEN